MPTNNTKLDLLLKEIQDPYVQENFYRLKLYIDKLIDDGQIGVSSGDTIVNQNITATSEWERDVDTIPAGGTLVVDKISLNDFSRIKYLMSFKDASTNSTKGFDLNVQNNNGVLTESVNNILGASLNILTNVTDDGVDMSLEITNNELNNIELSFLRSIL